MTKHYPNNYPKDYPTFEEVLKLTKLRDIRYFLTMCDNVSEACENSHSNHHKCVNEARWNETTTILKSEIKE